MIIHIELYPNKAECDIYYNFVGPIGLYKKISNKLYTNKAKEIGKERLKFMDEYFNRLKSELEGIK